MDIITNSGNIPAAQDDGLYQRLIALLDGHGARYRVLDHPPEGRTDVVSGYRGHPVGQAAKCVVLLVKEGRKATKYVLAVVPGDARVDFDAVKRLKEGTYVGFADARTAEALAGSASGTILPFAFYPGLELIADGGLFEHTEIFFNAARLDRSLGLHTEDYRAIAQPRLARIAKR
jgi:Ala-tRNA(Pro) deacylase